jgi:HPt (histidine-containing phosphotransfer) domain-containing protein
MTAIAAEEACVVDLEALKSRCLGNLNLVGRVLSKFSVQLDADLAELARSLLDNDAPAFALVAHRIKGMSANVEARELSQYAAAAEQCALRHNVEQLPSFLSQLQQERARINQSLLGVKIGS